MKLKVTDQPKPTDISRAIRQIFQQMEMPPEGTLKWAVVKANAMVMGLLPIAMAIQDDVDGLCFQY